MALLRWSPFLVLFFFLGLILQSSWLVFFSVVVAVVIALAYLWGAHALDQVVYHRRWRYRRGFPGEQFPVKIEVENRKLLPISWLHILDPWPMTVGPSDPSILAPSHIHIPGLLVTLCSLRWHERVIRSYDLLLRQRGVYQVGPASLQSSDLFGLFKTFREQDSQEYVTVYPELLPLTIPLLPTQDPFGDHAVRRRLFEDPSRPIGVRPYHPEDEFRRIHWPATARSGSLQAKIYQSVSAQVMMVCLNVSTARQAWLGTDNDMLEQLIKVSATVVYQSMQSGYAVGLMSNGCLAHADHPFQIQPGRTTNQLAYLLQALAAVTPYTTAAFENYLIKALPKITYGASLVIVTALVTSNLVETLLRLKRYRTNTTLISLETTSPPTIQGVHNLHMPFYGQ